ALAHQEVAVLALDPIREDARGNRDVQDRRARLRLELDLAGRAEPGLQLLRVELALEPLEDRAPDLGHCGPPVFHRISTAVEARVEARGRGVYRRISDLRF